MSLRPPSCALVLLALACGPTEAPADAASTSTGSSTSTDTSSTPTTTAAPTTSEAPTATATTEASTCGETFDPTDSRAGQSPMELVTVGDFDPQSDQAIEYDFIGRKIAGRYTILG